MPSAVSSAPLLAPLIVTALLSTENFAAFNALRQRHYPPDRNVVPAHISLFHHLPPARLSELVRLLRDVTQDPPPAAWVGGVLKLRRGNAYRVDSPALLTLWERIADWFAADLTEQDRHSPQFHITIQNKVSLEEAKAVHAELCTTFRPHAVNIVGLAIWAYRDGPWELLRRLPFYGARL
jgi:hypothetical protein